MTTHPKAPGHEIRVQQWRHGSPSVVACSCGYVPKYKVAAIDIDPEDDLVMHIAMHMRGATLLNRDVTPEERELDALSPRIGHWPSVIREIEGPSEYHQLSQEETDQAIAVELHDFYTPAAERDELAQLIKPFVGASQVYGPIRRQLGGVHSDPFVRVLAFRAWGRRDLDWTLPAIRKAKPRTAIAHETNRHRAGSGKSTPSAKHLHQLGCEDPHCDGQCVR